MNKLPEKVAVILIYRDGSTLRKTAKRTSYEAIVNGWITLSSSQRECRIYPVNARHSVHLTDLNIQLAWNEALTLSEFKEYLND